MTDASVWLEQAQGLAALPGDAERLRQHWTSDRALLDRGMAMHAASGGVAFFDRSPAAFDWMIGR